MKSYIPKQEKPTKERFETKLDREVIQRLEAYCQYLESDRDYVIAQALEIAFKKDKGFAQWLAAQEPTELVGTEAPARQRAAIRSGS